MSRTRNHLAAAAAILGLSGTIAGAIASPHLTTVCWLFAALLGMSMPVGALTLLMIGKLTGGLWVESLASVLLPLSRLVPVAGLAFIPLLFFLAQIYPWAAEGAKDMSVGALYLNWPFVAVRLVVAFAGWSLLAFVVVPLPGSAGQIAAGVGLIFHIVMTTLIGYDWILALQPALTTTAFGAHMAVLFLLSALAFAALFGRLEPEKASKDVAGLIIACVLGAVYLGFMQFLIIWYGDLKDTAKFYLDRAGPAPRSTIIAALILGGLVPLAMLISEEGRRSPEIVRGAALFVLMGIVLHWAWVIFDLFPGTALIIAPAPVLVIGCCLWLAARPAAMALLPGGDLRI